MSTKPLGALALSLLLAACADAGLRGGSGADPVAASSVASASPSCDAQFREIDQELSQALMKTEDMHDERSAAIGAYQRCLAGDADAFEAL